MGAKTDDHKIDDDEADDDKTDDHRTNDKQLDSTNMTALESEEYPVKRKKQKAKGLKISTPNQMLSRFLYFN